MENKYTGEVVLDIQGKPHKIFFDWAALAALKTKINVDEIPKILKSQDPEQIAIILACGLQRHHPHMTVKKILEISPPFITTVVALDTALAYAYFGAGERPKPKKDSKKKP